MHRGGFFILQQAAKEPKGEVFTLVRNVPEIRLGVGENLNTLLAESISNNNLAMITWLLNPEQREAQKQAASSF